MEDELKPIRTKADCENALAETEHLRGAKIGAKNGDRLDILATLIDAYEAEPIQWIRPIRIEGDRMSHGAAGSIAQGPGAAYRYSHTCRGSLIASAAYRLP